MISRLSTSLTLRRFVELGQTIFLRAIHKNKMSRYTLEEKIFLENPPFFLFDQSRMSGRTDLQYQKEGSDVIDEFKWHHKQKMQEARNFVDAVNASQEGFIDFFNHLKGAWAEYLELSSHMNAYSQNLNFLFPEKVQILRDLVDTTFRLNSHLYFITEVEKEIYEKAMSQLEEERFLELVEATRSFPTYMAESLGDSPDLGRNPYLSFMEVNANPELRKILQASGGSIENVGRLISSTGRRKDTSQSASSFTPKNDFEAALQGILAYDHFFELFLRKSGILMTDLKFYVDLGKRIGSEIEVGRILDSLDELDSTSQRIYQARLPEYLQTDLSCGATCLANAVGTFYPHVDVDKTLEDGIHELVTVRGFFNNLPSSLANIANTKFGIPAKFFAEMESFGPLYLEKKSETQPIKKFQEDFDKVASIDYNNVNPDFLIEKLRSGHFISYVTGNGPMKHYKMVCGYNRENDKLDFYVFDPNQGTKILCSNKLLREFRNDQSIWGVEYEAPEKALFESTRKLISKAEDSLKWNPQ